MNDTLQSSSGKQAVPLIALVTSILLYTLTFLIFSRPLYTHFADSIIAGQPDAHQFIWNVSYFSSKVCALQNPFYTSDLFYPAGTWLIMHTYTPIIGMFNLFLQNSVLSINIWIFVNYILSGVGALLLCYRFVPNVFLSFIAGFAFAFCPYKSTHLLAGHFNLVLTAPVPFYVLGMLSIVKPIINQRFRAFAIDWKRFVFLPALFTLELLSDYYLTWYLLIFTIGYIGYYTLNVWTWGEKIFGRIILGMITVSFVAIGLFELCHVKQIGLYSSFDVISFFVPSAFSELFGGPTALFIRSHVIKGGPYENTIEIGWVLIVLVVRYLLSDLIRSALPQAKILIFMAVLFAMFGAPVLNIAGHPLVPFPTAILNYIPFINNFREASRFVIMVMLFVPVMSMLFLHFSIFPYLSKIARNSACVAILSLLFLEYLPHSNPLYTTTDIPAVYKQLAKELPGTVLEIPYGIESGTDVSMGRIIINQMDYQAYHKKPVLGGFISRLPKSVVSRYDRYPVAKSIIELVRSDRLVASNPDSQEVKRYLNDFHIRYVIIYPGYEHSAAGEYVLKIMGPYIVKQEVVEGYVYLTIREMQ